MATITFCGESFIVDHAVKGSDYVHGYDANGNLVVSFDGVSDFSKITYDGEYMDPDDCLPEACNDVKYCGGKLKTRGGSDIPAAAVGAAASGHKHSAADMTSGVLPYAQGGTGKALGDVPNYAIMRNAGDGDYMWYIATGNGALYATTTNGSPKFGTLPVAQGGTGATSEANARSKLGTNMKLLWENASPASTFAGFTPLTNDDLAESLANFTAIEVWYRTYKSDNIYVSHIVPIGVGSGTSHDDIQQVTECQAAGNNKWCRRYCFASTSAVTFGTGGHRTAVGNNWTVDSTYMIPVRIYGIR